MSGIFKSIIKVAAVVAAVALAIPSGGTSLLAVTLGVSAAAASGIAAGLALGASLLSRPKAPATSPASTDRLTANIDPKTPRKFVLGRTAMATDIRDQELTNNQEYLHRFVVTSSHRASDIEEIWFDDKRAWSSASGVTSDFTGYLTVTPILEGSAGNAINLSARMGATRRYTGLSYVYFRFKLTGNSKKAESPFAQSIPTRVTIIGKGAPTYDPRLDSTVAGGSGAHRAADQTTWVWNDAASRNPALQLLWYLLGWRIKNPATNEWRLAVGKGIPASRIDLASFITAANLCDEPVALAAGGMQARYRSDGVFSEGDATGTVLDQLKAAMNAELDDVDGKIRITVLHNDLATPIADFNDDDILGGFTWDQTAPLDETYNVVRGTFIDPSTTSLYQAVDFPEVRIDSLDGIDRIETVDFQTVQDASQAQRLVKQRIARMLYSGRFTATFSYRAWTVQKNDVIRLTFSALGWANKLFRVVETAVQVDGQVPMVLQEENADIYLWDRDERPAIQPVQPTSYDPYLNPIYQDVIEPKYADGTTIDQLRPAEPGATNGASPGEKIILDQIQLDLVQLDEDAAAARERLDQIEPAIDTIEEAVAANSETAALLGQELTKQGTTLATVRDQIGVMATDDEALAGALLAATIKTAQNSAAFSQERTLQSNATEVVARSVDKIGLTVGQHAAEILDQREIIGVIEGDVTTLYARLYFGVGVDGRIAFMTIDNNGIASRVKFGATALEIGDPDNASGFHYSNGRIRVSKSGDFMKVMGDGFGSSGQFIEWYGPYQSNFALCTEANAISYLKTNGDAYFGGAITTGTFRNSVTGTLNQDPSSETILGPFSTNGGTKAVSVSAVYNMTHGSFTSGPTLTSPGNPSFRVTLLRSRDGVGYSQLAQYTFTGNVSVTPAQGGDPGSISMNIAGNFTFTDNGGNGTAPMYYKVVIDNRFFPTYSGTSSGPASATQRATIISTE
jgi:hypothetical protein